MVVQKVNLNSDSIYENKNLMINVFRWNYHIIKYVIFRIK